MLVVTHISTARMKEHVEKVSLGKFIVKLYLETAEEMLVLYSLVASVVHYIWDKKTNVT